MIQEQKKKSIALSIMFALAVLVMLLISLSVAALVEGNTSSSTPHATSSTVLNTWIILFSFMERGLLYPLHCNSQI